MKQPPRTPLLIRFLFLVLACGSLLGQEELDQILRQIEETGSDLSAMKAEIRETKWTDILEEFDQGETGDFLFLRQQGEVYLRKDINEPQASHLVISKGEVTFYQPALKQAQKYQLGSNKDKAEFLLLGFGTSRQALEEVYDIRYLGEEEIDGKKTFQIELKPKSNQVSAFFNRIVLWIDPEKWVPIQQMLVEPTDDYLLVNFYNIELNPKLKPSDFRLKLPSDVKVLGS